MNVSLKTINIFLMFFIALLPLQLTLRHLLHLPLLIYFFLLFAFLYILVFQKTSLKYCKIQKIFFCILFGFFIEMLISVILNYSLVVPFDIPFEYYVTRYSKFWDSPYMSSIFAGILRPGIYFLFSVFLIFFFYKNNNYRFLIRILIVIGFISSIYSIYQLFAYQFGLPFSSVFSGHNGEIIEMMGVRRCEGIFYEPGPQATYLSVIFPLLLCQFFAKSNEKLFNKNFNIIMLITVTFTLFATLSPIGMLTPFISVPIILWIFRNQLSINTKKKIFLLFCVLCFVFFFVTIYINNNLSFSVFQYLKNRIMNLGINNTIFLGDDRSVRNEITVKLIRDYKWFGVGPGNDGFYYALYAPYAIGRKIDKGIAINQNLKILSDSGIFGFVFYMLLLVYPFYIYLKLRLYNYYISYFDSIINALFVAIVLFAILTFNAQVEFFQPLFWIVYSLLLVVIINKYKFIKETTKRNAYKEKV